MYSIKMLCEVYYSIFVIYNAYRYALGNQVSEGWYSPVDIQWEFTHSDSWLWEVWLQEGFWVSGK